MAAPDPKADDLVTEGPLKHRHLAPDVTDKKVNHMEPEVEKVQSIEEGEVERIDLFAPLPGHPDLSITRNGQVLTIRATVVGWLLGAIVSANNVYLGLKAGIAFDATFFGALLGFVIIKPLSRLKVPLIGGDFGPREHSIVQTVATATGGLSTLFICSVPAMFQVGAMGPDVESEYGRLVALTAASALFGSIMAVPLRHFFIIKMGRELSMVFPSAVAAATVIRSLHLKSDGMKVKLMVKVLLSTLVISCIWVVGTSYAKGILFDWYVLWWIYAWSGYKNLGAIQAVSWGFFTIEWSPAMIGTGMLIPLNASVSWCIGYIVAFGIIGPILVAKGKAVGLAYSAEYPDLVTYMGLESADYINQPSPRYWVLWPALLCMICVSIAGIASSKDIYKVASLGLGSVARTVNKVAARAGFTRPLLPESARDDGRMVIEDFAAAESQPRSLEVVLLLVAGIIVAVVVMTVKYDLDAGLAVLTLVLSFIFALMAILITGQVGVSPISTVAQASQIIIGGIQRGMDLPAQQAMLSNLAAGSVSSTAAQQSTELLTDYKIGFFLRTPPRAQLYGQLLGCLLAIFLSPLMFMVFMKGYPCVLDLTQAATCAFSGPAIQSYRAVTIAIIDPTFPIPVESWAFALGFAALGVALTVLRARAYSKNWKTLGDCIPNMLMVCMGMIIPALQYGIAFVIGGLLIKLWGKKRPATARTFGICVAAGMLAGEGIGGMVNAVLALAKVGGPTYYGTQVGCPGGAC